MRSSRHDFDESRPHDEDIASPSACSDPQNIYDHPRFFEAYRALRQSDTGLNGGLEIPALRALLPDLTGKNVLDLGCGFGDFAWYAAAQGARSVIALDVAEKMIAEANRLTTDEGIVFCRCSIEEFVPKPEEFDLVVSSLALHYVDNFEAVARAIFEALKPGGCFIFSVEHPVCTANPEGWILDREGNFLHWPLDHYQHEGARSTSWFVDGVTKYHRTTETYVNTLLKSGFRLLHLGSRAHSRDF